MPQDYPQRITEKTLIKFAISTSGLYAINVTARCKKNDDLRVEIDKQFFREIPPEKNIQKYDVPPAWNGSRLQGSSQTNIFIIWLEKGEHTIAFIPKGHAQVESFDYWQVLNATNIECNLGKKAENGNQRPWITITLVNLPLKSIVAEASIDWHVYDGDDVKLIIDNEIEKNADSRLWRNWLWHTSPKQLLRGSKKEQKTITKNLPKGIHYIEFWADKTPTLHQVVLDLGDLETESAQPKPTNTPTVENPKWTGDFSDDPEQLLLARLIIGEMEGQSRKAKLGAAFTVINRLKKARSNWGLSIHEIILKQGQYDAFWNDNTKDKVRDPLSHVSKDEWEESYKIAGIVIEGKEEDPTTGATNFFSTGTDTGFPWWATEKTYRTKIGITYFYELES